MKRLSPFVLLFSVPVLAAEATLGRCSGYTLTRTYERDNFLLADIDLIGRGCGVYGPDVPRLSVLVEWQTNDRLHVLIQDRDSPRYQVSEDVFPRPNTRTAGINKESSGLSFAFSFDTFSFKVIRTSTREVLFDTFGTTFVFEPQFIRLKTWLPPDPNIYGLGEHIDSFRLSNINYTRTLWNRDSDGVPYGENLYSSHPVYFEHRRGSTHGVFLLNSNGMDLTLDRSENGRHYLEIITIGGVIDLYFLAGPSPVDVARQYAEVAGTPAMVPYWSLGFHQCKFGYQDWFQVAEVIANYSAANIPLETMWTDIDYMNFRGVFSLDTKRFPISKMREIVRHLHNNQQNYILMVDPAVAYRDYEAYHSGAKSDVFLKAPDSNYFRGVVWPGVAVFPDWYHRNVRRYWNEQIRKQFDPETGVDIDGIWIDMNEPASMCPFPCRDPNKVADELGMPPQPPPVRKPPRDLPGFPPSIFHEEEANSGDPKEEGGPVVYQEKQDSVLHESDRNLLYPPYSILNGGPTGRLSDLTVPTNIRHANGLLEYDIHNLYGAMMGMATQEAMLRRRPGLRPFIITRSTFAGSGRYVQKWLGDNASRWDHYRSTIAGMLAFASIYQIPMVGSDVCGFKLTPSPTLCARWATLGAFAPFYRNHAHDEAPPQELYLDPLVASAARHAIALRYRLLDYIYTALQRQSRDGTPAVNPLWFIYPWDESTFGLDLQYFLGDSLLVSPVLEEDATSVNIYLPDDLFYEYETGRRVRGRGDWVRVRDVPFDRIPLHVRGGSVMPLRVEAANTTTELRKKRFELLVAPGLDGEAEGTLTADDGVSLDGGSEWVALQFVYTGGKLTTKVVDGVTSGKRSETLTQRMGRAGVEIESVRILGGDEGEVIQVWQDDSVVRDEL